MGSWTEEAGFRVIELWVEGPATDPPLPQAVTPHLIVAVPCRVDPRPRRVLACPAATRARVPVQRIHPARCAHAAHLHVPSRRS